MDGPANSRRINRAIADRLDEAAKLLEEQQANPFRVRAYRRAAETVAGLGEAIDAFFLRNGIEGLQSLPGIGPVLASAIAEMIRTGHWAQLARLRGASEPEKLFQAVPGIGPELARRLHEFLQVDSLEALEAAAHDGRLAGVPGIGRRRATALRAALAAMLQRPRPTAGRAVAEPQVDLLLDVDAEYRASAKADKLPKIAPRRFNPSGEAWLPVLHTERGPWQFTALYSNTARAHELKRTGDWVVIYFHTDSRPEGQRTVVSESRGEFAGLRVVRGREADCRAYYEEVRRSAAAAAVVSAKRRAPA